MISENNHNPYMNRTYFESRFSAHPARDALWQVLCAHLERDFPDTMPFSNLVARTATSSIM